MNYTNEGLRAPRDDPRAEASVPHYPARVQQIATILIAVDAFIAFLERPPPQTSKLSLDTPDIQ